MCNNCEKGEKKSVFYIIGIIVAAAAVVAGAAITAVHFILKKKNKDSEELVYEFDCEDGDCSECELAEECEKAAQEELDSPTEEE